MNIFRGGSWICPQYHSKPIPGLFSDRSHRPEPGFPQLLDRPQGDAISRLVIARGVGHNLDKVTQNAQLNRHAGLGHLRLVRL